jgi:PPOX class probable F420-dependent enzyme
MQSIPSSHRDLLDSEFATLATVGANGRPHQSVIWFLAEGDQVRLSLNTARQKTINLQRNPSCSLVIIDPASAYRYLELRGHAELEPDADYAFADKLGAKYSSDLRQHDGPGEIRVVATVIADRARAIDLRG